LSIDAEGTYSLRATGTEVFTAYAPAPVISNTFNVALFTLTAGATPVPGYTYIGKGITGFGNYGAISPTSYNGATILEIYSGQGFPPIDNTTLVLNGTIAQDAFTSITVNGVTFNSVDASYSTGATTSWQWIAAPVFPSIGTYFISFT
jgi:hypothetical protein